MMVLGLLATAAASPAVAQQPAAGAMSDDDIVRSALSAAPEAVAKGATVVAVEADGKIRTVRKGTNAFTCVADNPGTPSPDPMCGDQNAMLWVKAWLARKKPPSGKVGIMYMLSGGSDASNTDPYATKPSPGNNWIETGPHVMVVGAGRAVAGHPKLPKPDTAQPYVMWAGTPYEHLMIPIK
ncbi:hypothetical protein QNA08_17525 [Chelatococcus sp. SYSU_G07232]|uniref:Uncharacterized protein n=1 Tax=Chelatococcus albus TaxID=3047466 RepID=A0ABT7AKW3_9HYPH|nr:hypothetical protein [Chelatococcus sp. SYSU_G07232]MDJ1160017.1 hypothetical protein [Chelatococcus sp. SYSU_G07232]